MIKLKYQKRFKLFSLLLIIWIALHYCLGCGTDVYFETADIQAYLDAPFSVCYIDVGQGDCSLIQCGGEYMLIDSGEAEYCDVLDDYFISFGIDMLEYVIITHPHSDHMGGMNKVLEAVCVNNIIMPDIENDIKEYELLIETIEDKDLTVTRPFSGDVYILGDGIFTILAPISDTYEELNNYSIVLKFDYMDTSFLFTGDCQEQAEEELMKSGYNLKSDVLKVGHHGSRTSSSPGFISSVSPVIGIIQVGEDNTYGHPHSDVIDVLADNNVSCYCTADYGSIIIISDGSNLIMMTEKAFH